MRSAPAPRRQPALLAAALLLCGGLPPLALTGCDDTVQRSPEEQEIYNRQLNMGDGDDDVVPN